MNTKISILCISILVVLISPQAFADTLNLTDLPVTKVNGYYVGAIGGNLNGGTKANYYCDDFATSTTIPNSIQVIVSSISDISKTKFADQTNALQKYYQVGWLMYEMEINPTKVASLQFAMWSVFNPSTPTFEDSASWLDASTKINIADYDFSKMRIYTPKNASRNQEFVGGSVGMTATPEPGQWALMIIGMGLIGYTLFNRRKAPVLVRSIK